jgi:prepilin-type N-terminal cleavage/methylation domain-containing protein
MKRASATRFRSGFTLIEMMVVTAIIALLASIGSIYYNKSRLYSQRNACMKNLSTIESAKQIWGVEKGKAAGAIPVEADLIGPSLYIKTMPVCPGGGTYSFGSIGSDASCTLVAEGHVL